MKKILFSLFIAIAVAIPASAYDAASRVSTIGNTLLTKNGIPTTNVKFMVVSGTPDNSNYSTNRVVNVSTKNLAYAGNDNEVASVVANELGHIIYGHASKKKFWSLFTTGTQTNDLASTIAEDYKLTKEEKEADVISVNLMANAGYNPLASIVVLTKQTGTYWDAIQGKPANAERAMNIYDYTGYAYPAKLSAGYGCNEYRNFLTYANTVTAQRKASTKLQNKYNKEMKKYRKNSLDKISKFKVRGGISGWDAAYGILNAN